MTNVNDPTPTWLNLDGVVPADQRRAITAAISAATADFVGLRAEFATLLERHAAAITAPKIDMDQRGELPDEVLDVLTRLLGWNQLNNLLDTLSVAARRADEGDVDAALSALAGES